MKILGILIIAAGFVLFAQSRYVATLICLLIGAIFLGKPKYRRSAPPDTPTDEDPPDGEIVRAEAPLQKYRGTVSDYRRLAFPVYGTMVNNDDGSSRQEYLRALCAGGDTAVVKFWLDDYLIDGKLAIRVMTDEGCVGEIRPKDVTTVRGYFGKKVRMNYLEITTEKNEAGGTVYRADVVIIEESDTPQE